MENNQDSVYSIHNLKPAEGSHHRKKRIGRGIGSGHGKTATRGHKGDKARGQVNPNFEGGQTPLHRRLPQRRGLRSRNPFGFHKIRDRSLNILNIDLLADNFDSDSEITPEMLVELGLLREIGYGLKILANGDLNKPLHIKAHAFSASAQEKITAAGGTVTVLDRPRYADVN